MDVWVVRGCSGVHIQGQMYDCWSKHSSPPFFVSEVHTQGIPCAGQALYPWATAKHPPARPLAVLDEPGQPNPSLAF